MIPDIEILGGSVATGQRLKVEFDNLGIRRDENGIGQEPRLGRKEHASADKRQEVTSKHGAILQDAPDWFNRNHARGFALTIKGTSWRKSTKSHSAEGSSVLVWTTNMP